jgi:hypothetical protein
MGGCFSNNKKTSLESNKCSTCSLDEFEKRINPLIDNTKLSKYRRNILKKRYTKLVIYYENYANNIRWKYNTCRIIISIGSMILPTLQTIQNNENVSFIKNEIFWAAIGTSLSVMISNNLISMFSLDRRYIMYAVTAEKLKSVGWKYFELSDIFSNKSHKDNWVLFWNEVEKIKKLQVIAEFTDNDDKQHESLPPIENNKNETDSEYDSDSSYSSQTKIKKKEFYDDNVVINLEEERKKRIEEKNNTENVIKTSEENVEIVLENLQKTIVENLNTEKTDKDNLDRKKIN